MPDYTIDTNTTEDVIPEVIHKAFACGQCPLEADTYEEILDHVCPTLGCKLTDPQSMGENYQEIQDAAIKRGSRKRIEEIHIELESVSNPIEERQLETELAKHEQIIEDLAEPTQSVLIRRSDGAKFISNPDGGLAQIP